MSGGVSPDTKNTAKITRFMQDYHLYKTQAEEELKVTLLIILLIHFYLFIL